MSRHQGGEVTAVLAPEPPSVGEARRLVSSTLASWDRPQLVDDAILIVSELVTNAVLHARTESVLVVGLRADRLRIELTDLAAAAPVAKVHGAEVATGRGLHVVARLAADWGVDSEPPGKRIWVELSEPVATPSGTEVDLDDWDDLDVPAPGPEATTPTELTFVEVHLCGLPLAIEERSSAHYDELLREFQLIQARSPEHLVPARLVSLVDQVTARFGPFTAGTRAEMQAARLQGQDSIDLVYRVPPEAGDAARGLDTALDEADAYCRSGGELLTLAAPVDVVAYRRWVLGNFAVQAEGAPPRPWAAAPGPTESHG